MKVQTLPANNIPVNLHYRWAVLGVCWMAFIVAYMQRLSIGPLAPFLRDSLHLTKSQTGLFSSAAALGYTVSLIPAGRLADKLGVRWVLLVGEVVGGIFVSCMFFVTTFQQGLIFMGLAGIGMGCLAPSTTKAVLAWFPAKERATAMGVKQTAVNIGGIITAATLPAIAIARGWNYGFLSIGIIALIIGVVSFVLYRDPPQLPGVNVVKAAATGNKPSLIDIFRGRDIWMLIGAGICLMVIEFSATAYFVLYLNESLLFPVVTAGFFLAVMEAGGAFGKPLSGLLSDRVFHGKRKNVFIIMCFLAVIGCAIFSFLPQGSPRWILVVTALLFGFAAIGWGGLQMTLAAEFAGPEMAGTVTGACSTFLMMGNVVGPPLFGHIADISSYQTAWKLLTVLGIVAMALLFFLRENRKRI